MKSTKQKNLLRPVAFFALVAILILTVCFAASGHSETPNEGDGQTPPEESGEQKEPVSAPLPEYFDRLTGLPTTIDKADDASIAFVLNSTDPLFGVKSSKVTIEIPTECGGTRLVVHIDKDTLPGKIGSLSPTRGYISSLSSAFSGLLVSYGNDGKLGTTENVNSFDMSEAIGYSYTEYTTYHYTNADLVTAGIKNLSLADNTVDVLPYTFVKYGDEIRYTQRAARLTTPYSNVNTTDLVYSGETGEYTLLKNGNATIDLLNGKAITYKNVFLLYADSITYETSDYTEMILNTDGGKGLYLTGGTYTEIYWFRGDNGELIFTTPSGDILEINRGTSFISVAKSSESKSITII